MYSMCIQDSANVTSFYKKHLEYGVLSDLRAILYIMYTFYTHTHIVDHILNSELRKFRLVQNWYRTVAFVRTITRNHRSCTSRITAEKLTVPQLVKKFTAFYGTRRSLLQSQQLSTCSYPKPDQSSPCPHPTSKRSILTLYSHLRLGLPSGLFPSVLPTKTQYAALLHDSSISFFLI